MDDAFEAAAGFLLREARLLERRLFAACFLGAGPVGVVDAVRAYRNEDGGFGHGLEPDVRCPASLPIDTEVALQTLLIAGACDRELVRGACEFLSTSAAASGSEGAVAAASPVIEAFPRAAHWTDWTYEPGLNPTAGLAGLLHTLGVDHPWLEAATGWCWSRLETGEPPADAHALSEVLVFLEHVPERERATARAAELATDFADVPMLHLDPDAPGYGLTPLHLAPSASSPWRVLFAEDLLAAHLDHLEQRQQPDGGWPIGWEPPSSAATLEWRGVVTLQALRTLASYGRLDAGSSDPASRVQPEAAR